MKDEFEPIDNGYHDSVFDEKVREIVRFEDTKRKYREIVGWLNELSLGNYGAVSDEELGLLVDQLQSIELIPEIGHY